MSTTITHSNDVERQVEKYQDITIGETYTMADSGKTIKVSGTGGTVTLPAPTEGFNIRFVTTGGTADVMEGSIIVAGAVVDVDAADQLNFVHTADNLGDFVEIISDGSNYYVSGNALNSGGITATG